MPRQRSAATEIEGLRQAAQRDREAADAQHAGGQLKGNVHLKAADDTPMANVMLTLLHNLGLDDMKSFGDSTGEFSLSVPAAQTIA